MNVARSIGSTLGSVVAKTGMATKRSARPVLVKKSRSKAGKTRSKRSA
jgi:hypothetical protein